MSLDFHFKELLGIPKSHPWYTVGMDIFWNHPFSHWMSDVGVATLGYFYRV